MYIGNTPYTYIGLLINLALCILAGFIASKRGRSAVLWTVISLFVTPILGIIVVLLLPSKAYDYKFDSASGTMVRVEKDEDK